MTTPEQEQLARDCAEVADLTAQARDWIARPENADMVGAEARSLSRMMGRSIRRSRRLARAAETPMSVSVFGPSQAGKSFLVSVLARPEGGRLVGAYDGGAMDYIAEVNPEGEGESTGLVTRFTMERQPTPEGFPIRLSLLSESDLIRIVVNSFFNDGDGSEEPIDVSDLSAHLDTYKARAGAVQPGLDGDGVLDIAEYVEATFRKSAYAAALKPFWEEAAEIAPRLGIEDRAGFFSVLWGRHSALGDLYAQLARALATLDHAEVVHAERAALIPRGQSIIDVKTLTGLRGADVGPPVAIRTEAGRELRLPRAELCALAAELVFPMQDRPSELFGRTDLLDFPGARNRFEEPLDKTLNDLDKNLHQLLLRGKVAYLFDRYVEHQEITSMLLCVPGSNMETLDLPGLVDTWIARTHGDTPEQRALTDNVLFFVLTKFDMQLGESAADGGVETRFERRMQASLLERFGRGQDPWVDEWTPGQPFENCYWLRNPNYYVDGLVEYDDARRELRLRPEKQARLAELKSGCLSAPPVRRHFAEPERAWDAAMQLNDGGVTYLTEQLARVCKPDSKLRQIAVQLDAIRAELARAMQPYHVSDDVEQRVAQAQEAANRVIDDLEQVLARHQFGAVLSGLTVDQDLIEARIGRVPSSVRITSAVGGAGAEPARRGPQRPGRPRPAEARAPEAAASDIRTMTLEQFQAETALECWIDALKAFRDDRARLAAFGLGEPAAGDLVAELIHAVRRTGLLARIARAFEAVNFGLSVEKQAPPAAILGAERINSFVATLGMDDQPESQRPQVQDANGGTRPVFRARPAHDTVDGLPPQPRNMAETMWTDWVFALDAMFQANAKDGAGGEIDIEQNLALGRILAQLESPA
ncbi:virulence factor SrfC family protein [Arenibacterium halophilum]|uniref:Virulence factor n=1 Tax=Arenibacterium halophilum TaxID=2583821 RepID=A0ABY2X9Q9_9RHOB|nr:virulence factor SrfC family protein [Arenibacterium halophilum]TMV12738.1 hypothetical protein FGK64_07990 [Arenibacterium halophilum]